MATEAMRAAVLSALGATPDECTELPALQREPLRPRGLDEVGRLPLADEPCVSAWEGYAREADAAGAWTVLRRSLVQLRFPVTSGMSASADYLAATRYLAPVNEDLTSLRLRRPDLLRIELHATPAGRLPVLIAPCRDDFVLLVQALTKRNEPVPILDSVGACMVAGYNTSTGCYDCESRRAVNNARRPKTSGAPSCGRCCGARRPTRTVSSSRRRCPTAPPRPTRSDSTPRRGSGSRWRSASSTSRCTTSPDGSSAR